MKPLTYTTKNQEETEELASLFAKRLKSGDVIAFFGGMGMGKTAFVRGLVKGLSISSFVSSPTFALVHEYKGDLTLFHFDMYRIETYDDLYFTGFFDYLETDSILAVEWSENIQNALPKNSIRISIERGMTETDRIISIDGGREEIYETTCD